MADDPPDSPPQRGPGGPLKWASDLSPVIQLLALVVTIIGVVVAFAALRNDKKTAGAPNGRSASNPPALTTPRSLTDEGLASDVWASGQAPTVITRLESPPTDSRTPGPIRPGEDIEVYTPRTLYQSAPSLRGETVVVVGKVIDKREVPTRFSLTGADTMSEVHVRGKRDGDLYVLVDPIQAISITSGPVAFALVPLARGRGRGREEQVVYAAGGDGRNLTASEVTLGDALRQRLRDLGG